MESQHQNPEFRINPENFHLCHCGFVFKINFKKKSFMKNIIGITNSLD